MQADLNSRVALYSLIIANLIPLVGVLWWQWDAGFLLLMYWAENLVVGFYNILRMLCTAIEDPIRLLGILFTVGFFLIHYGAFVGLHGVFLIEFLDFGDGSLKAMELKNWPGPLVFVGILFNVVKYVYSFMTTEMFFALLALLFSHGVSFIMNFVLPGEYKNTTAKKLMGRPYARILIMHFVVIIGGILIAETGSTTPMLLLLVVIKIIVDVVLHLRSYRKRQQST